MEPHSLQEVTDSLRGEGQHKGQPCSLPEHVGYSVMCGGCFFSAVRQERQEEREALEQTIRHLMAACKILMNAVPYQKATKWGIVNDAIVEGTAAIRGKEA